jgi:hypothetical protein
MNIKSAAVALATASAGSLALVGPASAATTMSGHYSQTTSGLSCTGQVLGDGDGGVLSVQVSGQETRPSDQHFRTHSIRTRMVAQEKTYDGTWKSVAWGPWASGHLGPSHSNDAGTVNISPFMWGGSTKPTLSVPVKGYDDLFRARVVSRLFDDEGVKIATLVTYQGQCRL